MMKTLSQKVLTSLLLAGFALSNVPCDCTAGASEMDSGHHHAHHHHQTNEHAGGDKSGDCDCPHAMCLDSDDEFSDLPLHRAQFALTAQTIQFDVPDITGINLPTYLVSNLTHHATGPPRTSTWRIADTPVRRHDILLN
ncbi:MAG: hypothetical protein AAF512_07925 [Pseudomonadota bacterium]